MKKMKKIVCLFACLFSLNSCAMGIVKPKTGDKTFICIYMLESNSSSSDSLSSLKDCPVTPPVKRTAGCPVSPVRRAGCPVTPVPKNNQLVFVEEANFAAVLVDK